MSYQTLIDSPIERYLIYKQTAERYRIIQLGITIFTKQPPTTTSSPSSPQYTALPYNFYIFPYEEYNNNQFNMDISSILFNKSHGIDFNKWIKQGVSYVNNEQLKRISEHLFNDNINKYTPLNRNVYKRITLYKKSDQEKYEQFLTKFYEFYTNTALKEMTYEKMPRHIMLYFINELPDNIIDTIYISNESRSTVKICKVSKDEKQLRIRHDDIVIANSIRNAKGVKNIFDCIIDKKKTVVGHNCIMDLMFCYTHFLGGLPEEYEVFKKKVKSEFHKVFDTKYIYITLQTKLNSNSNSNNVDTVALPPDKSFHLEDLFKYFYNKYKDKVNITIPSTVEINNNTVHYEDYLSSIDKSKFHNADYDSFVTGCAYVYMLEEFSHEAVDALSFKFNLIGSIYNCMNLNNVNDNAFTVENTNAFIIKQKSAGDGGNNELDKVIANSMGNGIQKVYFYEKDKSLVAFVNKECNFVNEINQCFNMLEALTLDEYKERNKQEKKERKKNNFKQNNNNNKK